MKAWRRYERLVHELCTQEFSNPALTVTPNTKIMGCYSEIGREIDVLIDSRFELDIERRIIIDAKCYSRPVNVKDVESFFGMVQDCSASKGILVCPNGYSKAAKKRAYDFIDIRILSLEELEKLDLSTWDDCQSKNCDNKVERGLVLWDSPWGIGPKNGSESIVCTGKCDVCGDFHVWCWSCGNRFSLANEDELQCDCKPAWFWLTAIEDEEIEGYKDEPSLSVYLLLCSLTDTFIADRKPVSRNSE